MKKVYRYFPICSRVIPGKFLSLLLTVFIYLAISFVVSVFEDVLSQIGLSGIFLQIIFRILDLYCYAGMLLSVFKFFQH